MGMGKNAHRPGKVSDRAFMRAPGVWNGIAKTCWRIECAKCGTTSDFASTATHTLPNPIGAARHYRNHGWYVGNGPRADICPKCQERKMNVTPIKSAAVAPSPSDTPPRVMGRDDRRIVFTRIDEVYLDAGRGYSGDWSDERVAKDINVPRAWVTAVRDEMFGPAVPADDAKALEDRAKHLAKLLQSLEQAMQTVLAGQAELDAEIKVLLARTGKAA